MVNRLNLLSRKHCVGSALTSAGDHGGICPRTLVKYKLSSLLTAPHFRPWQDAVAIWSSLCSRLLSWRCRFISRLQFSRVAAVTVHTQLTHYTECLINMLSCGISSRFSAQKWRGIIHSLCYFTGSFNSLFCINLTYLNDFSQ